MSLTSEEEKRRLAVVMRAKGLSEAEIERRLSQVKHEVQPANGGTEKKDKPNRTGRRPDPRRIPFDKLSQPYRFIALSDKVLPPENRLVALGEPLAEGYCATLTVEWIAETPLLVGGAAIPKKNENPPVEPLTIGGRYVLPGATLRGLIRSAVEVVAHGKMTQGNWHYRFGLRDFIHPYYRDEAGVSKVGEVRAGFLRIRDSTDADPSLSLVEMDGKRKVWELMPAEKDGKGWGHVEIGSLSELGASEDDLVAHKGWVEKDIKDKYAALGMMRGKQIVFEKESSFRFLSDENGRRIFAADKNGTAKGVMLVAGKLPGGGKKKFEYFVTRNSNPNASPFLLARDVVENFERLYSEPAKGEKLRPTGNWKHLKPAAESDGIPVFYVGDPDSKNHDPGFFFGLTRLFKIPHKRSVGDILRGSLEKHIPKGRTRRVGDHFVLDDYDNADFVETLFGYVVEPQDLRFEADNSVEPGAIARKGRIAFGFAFLSQDTPAKLSEPVEVIQMAPRASFAPFYLQGKIKDYSAGDSQLAGRKAYFPRYRNVTQQQALADFKNFGERQKALVRQSSGGRVSEDVVSRLSFLVPTSQRPLTFAGEIRLHNVTAVELGAVLFALTHGGDREQRFRHMIGRGKPFGAGQMRVGKILLRVEANRGGEDARVCLPAEEEKYNPASGKGLADEQGHSLTPFLVAFEAYLCKRLGLRSATDAPAIREWLGMADPAQGEVHARAGELFYHPFPQDRFDKPVSPFAAYRLLREATQSMATTDKPQGEDRLLPAPSADLLRR